MPVFQRGKSGNAEKRVALEVPKDEGARTPVKPRPAYTKGPFGTIVDSAQELCAGAYCTVTSARSPALTVALASFGATSPSYFTATT